jgi:hypothetical protein
MSYVICIGDSKKYNGTWQLIAGSTYEEVLKLLWQKHKEGGLNQMIEDINKNRNPITEVYGVVETNAMRHSNTTRFYIINPSKMSLIILAGSGEANDDGYLVDEYKLNGAEPDWKKVEELSELIEYQAKEKAQKRKMRS